MSRVIKPATSPVGRKQHERICVGCGRRDFVMRKDLARPCWDCYNAARKVAGGRKEHESVCPSCGRMSSVVQKRSVGKQCMPCAKSQHGLSRTRIYKIWHGMLARVDNPGSRFYARYGGRGIGVCDEWRDLQAFTAWAKSNGYADGLQIDRIDNDRGYSPLNCRWVTPAENSRTRSSTILTPEQVRDMRSLLDAGAATPLEIAESFGVSRRTVYSVRNGTNWTAI